MAARGNIEAIYPLTPVQDGILFHTLYAPDSPLYFQQYSARVEGDVDTGVFRKSWDVVIGRHQALRTLLTWEGRDQPLQIVRGEVEPEWRIEAWTDTDEHDVRLAEYLELDRKRGFDLSVAPLMRFALFQLGEREHRFIWSHHHIVVDGWSMGIVLDEVFRTYAALAAGGDPQLPPPSPYRAYINWLNDHDAAASQSHWRKILDGFTAATPLLIERRAMQTPWAERHAEAVVTIAAAQSAELAAAARRQGLTLNTLLRGAWALLLSRYSGSDDVVFGATSAGRPPAVDGIVEMVGMFINTLPVRVAIDPDATLVDWLHQIQDQQLASSAHETTPLADVQRWSEVAQGEPLFSSLLVFENVPHPATTETGLRTTDVRYLQRSNYPLAVLVMPQEEMELIFLYDADRFDAGVIHRMARQLESMLGFMAANMSQTLGEVQLLPPDELEEVLVSWNATRADYPHDRTMSELILTAAGTDPDRIAVTNGDVSISYRQLKADALAIAAHLHNIGVVPGSRVAVLMERSPAMVVAIVGVLLAGGAYVPMDPTQPEARRRYVFDDTEAAVVIVDAGSADRALGWTFVEVDPHGALMREATSSSPDPSKPHGQPQDLAYVLFTSGSTGRPKGVAVTHRNLVASTHARRDVYPGRVASFLLVSPLIFDSSLVGLFWTLYDCGTIVLPAPQMEQDVRHFAGLIERYAVTHTLALPSLYDLMLEHAASGELDSLRVVMVAGEACSPAVAARHHAALPDALLVNEYGPTEATVWCTAYTIDAADAFVEGGASRRIPIGRPISNTQIFILDNELRPVPVGVPGELCVAGHGLAAGYLGHPELTAQQFVEHRLPQIGDIRIYRTGDVARFLSDGTIDLLGRLDHQVKIRGQRIELSEIEMVLRDHPQVRDAAAVVRDRSTGGPTGGAQPVLVAYAATDARSDDLRQYLAARLPEVMVPSVIVTLEELPQGATGKVDRNALPQPDLAASTATHATVAPGSVVEHTLAGIWAEVLGLDAVGVTDDFFELGGDSILSIRIIARAHEAGLTITPRQFFETPTVAALAATLE